MFNSPKDSRGGFSALFFSVENSNRGYVGGSYSSLGKSPSLQDGSMAFFERYRNAAVDGLRQRYHRGGYNYLFVEGHVENFLTEETLGKSKNATSRNPMGVFGSADPND